MSLLILSLIFSVNEIVRRSRRGRLFSQTLCSHPFKPTHYPEKEKRGGGQQDSVVGEVTECSCLAVRSPLCFYGPVAAHSFLISVLEISRGITREEIVRGELFFFFFNFLASLLHRVRGGVSLGSLPTSLLGSRFL